MILRVFGARPFHADGDVLALAFAPDGGLWSIEEPGVLRRWDVAAQQQTAWHDLEEPATLWTFGPGARRVAAGSDELSLWDVATGEPLVRWPSPSWVTAVAFPPLGSLLATGHDDTAVRLWDVSRREVVRELRGHSLAVSALAFSPDGKRLATAGEDKIIRLWNVASGEPIGSLSGHTDRVPALAWHPDGKRLYSAGWDTTARIWDATTGEPIILLNSHVGQVQSLTLSADGSRLACADSANAVHIWDTRLMRTVAVLPEQAGEVRGLAFSADGRRLAAAGAERVVHLWDAEHDGGAAEETDPLASRSGAAFHADGDQVAGLAAGGELRIWNTTSGEPALPLADAGRLRAFAASPDGRWYAASQAVGDGPEQWNARVLPERDAPRTTLGLWDGRTGARTATLEGQGAPITTLVFDPDSQMLASAGFLSNDVWLWHVPSGEPALMLPAVAENCSVEALAFQPRGNLLAIAGIDWMPTSGEDGRVFLWNLAARAVVRTLPGGCVGLAFHPNGQRLAVATLAQTLCVYDVGTGELVMELIGHLDAVKCVAWSPGGRWIASGSDDRTVRLWDAETGLTREMAELDTQIKALAFSPDGRRLLTANGNTSSYLLDLSQFVQQ